MKRFSKQEVLENEEFIINEIRSNKVFIYPTDTLYGFGTNANNELATNRIKKIKRRENKPFSIVAPSKKWIEDNCKINNLFHKNFEKLPGPFTFLLELKEEKRKEIFATNTKKIGIRIPNSWFTEIIAKANIPFVSTSVNYSGEPSAVKLEDIPQEILDQVDYVIEDDNLSGKGSTIIDISGNEEVIIRK